ncbi:hypothetical protein F511_41212 [Dorcoceras hygrometricum]|uniref:Uncharacterized protein n=1 Tax=Dorcoceras hygrometricum TaxID=472368 RepID=A0A2Z7CZ45_9LAMI|nr:hypothetical protein F511_41212 [Dorcoceras hygrometricum]
MAGALPAGPPPGPAGPNLTNHGSTVDHPGRTKRCKWKHQPSGGMRHSRLLLHDLLRSTT